jgi:hypothetical protein
MGNIFIVHDIGMHPFHPNQDFSSELAVRVLAETCWYIKDIIQKDK